ncbi:uncharacterized protein BO88DRAFT_166270 [Aspergillus vadensis CBS 113365]|uniref:Uncharacterized protein n=1 Tax=Aspergillus vadensis (strain CBS 113365 / IMI 142717 / IBT 24658) TaxID=1448311 RepID=A0A319C306_ASPVC|nr:hypothetical protein BO88DRAFT_166270 [Aspergillus vadensis CBS 113365]PYH72603.1 hypothetical protein BO88DRAFT_166270 [Aspergillus vadensis CBS 113365]
MLITFLRSKLREKKPFCSPVRTEPSHAIFSFLSLLRILAWSCFCSVASPSSRLQHLCCPYHHAPGLSPHPFRNHPH